MPSRVTLRITKKEPLGIVLANVAGNAVVSSVTARDQEKRSTIGMTVHSVVSPTAGEQVLLGHEASAIGRIIKSLTPPYSLVFEGEEAQNVSVSAKMMPELENDLQQLRQCRASGHHVPAPKQAPMSDELRYATPSSIKAFHEAARDMHAASIKLTKGDPEAASMMELKANELFDKGRRCRDVFRKNAELGAYLGRNKESDAVAAALRKSKEEWLLIEQRKKCLHEQLERWGYVERAVPDDNNCQFHAIADQLNIDGTLPCPDRGSGLWNATVTRKRIVQWLQNHGGLKMDDGEVGEPTTLMMASGHANARHWKSYCRNMSRAGITWGDEVTLVAACALFKCEISVISNLTDDCIQTIESPRIWGVDVERRLVIAHYSEYHYASVQEKLFGDVVDDEDIKNRDLANAVPMYEADRISTCLKSDLHAPDGSLVGPGCNPEKK